MEILLSLYFVKDGNVNKSFKLSIFNDQGKTKCQINLLVKTVI